MASVDIGFPRQNLSISYQETSSKVGTKNRTQNLVSLEAVFISNSGKTTASYTDRGRYHEFEILYGQRAMVLCNTLPWTISEHGQERTGLNRTNWMPRLSARRRSAHYCNMFEGVCFPSSSSGVSSAFQIVKTIASGVRNWISKLNLWSSKAAQATLPDTDELGERNDISVRYVPFYTCRNGSWNTLK